MKIVWGGIRRDVKFSKDSVWCRQRDAESSMSRMLLRFTYIAFTVCVCTKIGGWFTAHKPSASLCTDCIILFVMKKHPCGRSSWIFNEIQSIVFSMISFFREKKWAFIANTAITTYTSIQIAYNHLFFISTRLCKHDVAYGFPLLFQKWLMTIYSLSRYMSGSGLFQLK